MDVVELAHKAISPILYSLGFYQRSWSRKAKTQGIVAVPYYHRIVDSHEVNSGLLADELGVPADIFEAQMRFMLKHFTPIRPSQVNEALKKPGLYFTVTFDDGFEDNYTVAAPILKKLGISGAFYVVSDYVGTDKLFWWEQLAYLLKNTQKKQIDISQVYPLWLEQEKLPKIILLDSAVHVQEAQKKLAAAFRHTKPCDIPQTILKLAKELAVAAVQIGRDHPLMNWEQLHDLQNQGFEIGGHTASHINLGKAETNDYAHEINQSTQDLSSKLKSPVETFAYPYGTFSHYTHAASKEVANNGYTCAFTTNNGVITQSSDKYEYPRFTLNKSWPFACAFNVASAFRSGS
ncbi:polysaccharide deacetylase family protein [Aliiglaciecola lipolytica]|uniref:NodB homology domain-containing protein n=1 Tax=Aliiglaciecola lipolytica E3 TaxID=1127673 RepID=K6XPU2_9ALTE|nr:polysaccharide deacetylase family protein [Aliiglaciecola lipolytica]GAC13701.1 hypothetical protein GLIP_1059 [Aliiglaciecola lipolytica E3]